MHRVCQERRGHGLLWIVTLAVLATFTVATCLKEERMVMKSSSTMLAMKQTGIVQ